MHFFLSFILTFFCFNLRAKTHEAELTQYQIDSSHSSLDFSIKHMMIANIRGTFRKWDGQFLFDPKTKKLSDIKINIEIQSIDTLEEKRDEHLKSKDFFDSSNFPLMTFISNKVEYKNKLPHKIIGELSLHGVKKIITLKVNYLGSTTSLTGAQMAAFKGQTQINRKDFGITWNKLLESGGIAVGEMVQINFDLEANPTNKF
jgi:polyisoprenoid-binding protein YceI